MEHRNGLPIQSKVKASILRFLAVIPLGLMTVLSLVSCDEQVDERKGPVSRPIKLITVGESDNEITLKYPGSVSAVKQSDMAFEVPGRITEMPVTEGERVEAGRLLARLDPRDYKSQRDRARAEANAARADFNRYDRAYKAKAVTAQELDMARRALGVANAELQRAEKAVEDTVLRAPFAGRVARKLVKDYANVQAKQPVLILQSEHALEMRVNVPEEDWVKEATVDSAADIEDKANISVVISSLKDQPIPATITAFQSNADPITRTFEVTVQFEPPEGVAISPGMTGHVAYVPTVESTDDLWVPASAVVAGPDNTPFVWLFRQEQGVISKQSVTLGGLSGENLAIESGLERGDRIAVSGVHMLSEGMPVHAMEK